MSDSRFLGSHDAHHLCKNSTLIFLTLKQAEAMLREAAAIPALNPYNQHILAYLLAARANDLRNRRWRPIGSCPDDVSAMTGNSFAI